MWTDMCGNKYITIKIVSFVLHIKQFCSESNSAECAITVGYKANTFRTCTNSAKSAKKSDCRSISTVCLAP